MLLTYCLSVSNFSLWLLCLLLRSGDIQPNPGPVSVTSIDSSISSVDLIEDLSNHLSILPKIDLIKCESHAYDILVFSEGWLKPDIKDDRIVIENFMPPY